LELGLADEGPGGQLEGDDECPDLAVGKVGLGLPATKVGLDEDGRGAHGDRYIS